MTRLSAVLMGVVALALFAMPPRLARAFGDEGAFDPRPLLVGRLKVDPARATAPARWSREIVNRTSAPARLAPAAVRADDDALFNEPFAYLFGEGPLDRLTDAEVSHFRRFFAEGGVLFVDDIDPESGEFGRAARREMVRVLPDAVPIAIGAEHVVFRSFYLLRRPVGRIEGPSKLDAIVQGGNAQVIFSSHDIAGALAQSGSSLSALPVTPGGERQRELAIRLAVNIAMYVLCSNYKDDQVHAPFLKRRTTTEPP